MAKRRAKRTVKQLSGKLPSDSNCTDAKELGIQNQSCQFIDHEVERRIAATQAIRDVEIEHLLTGLRLLRSNFNNEQLQTPVLQFIEETMPNLQAKISEKDGLFELDWKEKDNHPSVSQTDEKNLHASLLQWISKAYPDCAAGMPPVGGIEFSNNAANMDHLGSTSFQIPDFLMEQQSESQMLGLQESLQTPGAYSQRLSIGMTPKTLRLPKPGEMLLSVRGSPLGLYKEEDNMEAIRE